MDFDFERPFDTDDARFRLSAAARQIIAELVSSTATDDAFLAACALVEQAVAVLGERPHGRDYVGAEASLAEHQDSHFLDFSPFVGALNPLAPPISARIVEGAVVGDVVYTDPYEGPPGCVHGGFIAAGFDEMLGFAQSLSGQPGMTGRLLVSYRSPTPLHHPVRYEGRVERIEGRKIFTVATLHHGDTLCAEAEGLFISMKPEVFQRLMRDRSDQG
jgi:acyl-coenzyme A thioesterase PaaI-like protein